MEIGHLPAGTEVSTLVVCNLFVVSVVTSFQSNFVLTLTPILASNIFQNFSVSDASMAAEILRSASNDCVNTVPIASEYL